MNNCHMSICTLLLSPQDWRHYTPIADREEVQPALFLEGSQFLNTQIFEGEPGTSGGYHLTEVLPEPLKHTALEVSYLTAGGRTN